MAMENLSILSGLSSVLASHLDGTNRVTAGSTSSFTICSSHIFRQPVEISA